MVYSSVCFCFLIIYQKPAAIIPTSSNASSGLASTAPKFYDSNLQQQPSNLPPNYTQTSSQKLNLSDIEKQQEELNRRAAELERREQILNGTNTNVKNFPPFPQWCCNPFKPCYYQDINREIPAEFQKWVRVLFYLWICKTLK